MRVGRFSLPLLYNNKAEVMEDFYKKEIETIREHLKAGGADYDDIYQSELFIEISVIWGDWKHSHQWLDYLMEQIGYFLIENRVTESDGSDCYSSIHTYMRR